MLLAVAIVLLGLLALYDVNGAAKNRAGRSRL